MNFNPISTAFLDLNSKELTVGFQRIPGSHVFILGNEKGQIFKVGFDRENMKFLEMLLFFIIFNEFHVFFRENIFNTTFAGITKMKLNPFDGKSLMILSKDTNPQVL